VAYGYASTAEEDAHNSINLDIERVCATVCWRPSSAAFQPIVARAWPIACGSLVRLAGYLGLSAPMPSEAGRTQLAADFWAHGLMGYQGKARKGD